MATRWRLNPADMVYVGDNTAKDFQAPQQLGMRTEFYNNSDGLYFSDFNKTGITRVTDIIEIV